MTSPDVYRAINKVTKELSAAGISKRHTNDQGRYKYRSIDDLLNRLAPVVAKHRLCVLPRMLGREFAEMTGAGGEYVGRVVVRVAFDLISASDGSRHTLEAYGEALDTGDKGTSKAATAAFKSAIFQAFCIPVGLEDPDETSSHPLSMRTHRAAPDQGWEAWVKDLLEVFRSSESEETLRGVQQLHRERLLGLSRERSDLYDSVGVAFAARLAALKREAHPQADMGIAGNASSEKLATEKGLADA